MTRTPNELIREALLHLDTANHYATAEHLDQLAIDAICMRLAAGIEVLARLDEPIRHRIFGADWSLMWGMRNRIAHGYLLVDSSIIRQTIQIDLPSMLQTLRDELGS